MPAVMTSTLPRQGAFPRAGELALYAVSPLATLISAPILARALGPAARGQYGVATVVATFALTLGAWGQAETYLAEARAGRFGYTQQTRIAVVGGVVTAIATAAALLLLGLPLLTAVVTALWIPLLNQTNLWRSVSVASGHLRSPALGSALGPVVRVLALLVLLLTATLTVDTAVAVTQGAMLVAAIATIAIVARRVHAQRAGPTVPVRELLRSGGAVITFDVFNAFALRSDLIVLQLFVSPHDVGLYAAPAALTTAALALSVGFKSRIQAAVVAAKPPSAIVREVLPVLALGAVGAAALWVLAPWLVGVIFGSAYAGSIPLLRLLGVAAVPLLLFDLAQGVLVVLARRAALIMVGAVSATCIVGGLFALCPLLGVVGAALACLVGYSVAAVVGWTVLIQGLRRDRRAA